MINKKYKLIFEGIVFLFSMIWMILNFATKQKYHSYVVSIIMFVLSTFLVFYLEIDYFKTYKQIIGFNFTMDFLIAIATHITYLFSLIFSIIKIAENHSIHALDIEFWEVGFSLSFFIGVGHYLEDALKRKTSLGIKDLLKLQQKEILILDKKTNEYYKENSKNVQENTVIKVPKGSSIPTDGILLSDQVEVDCSSLLGESIPRTIKKNEQLFSGMINLNEVLIYRSTKKMQESMLNKIILQLENILKNKSNIERISEKIVKFFLPIVLIISLATFCIWLGLAYNNIGLKFAIANLENIDNQNPFVVAIYHSVATLVIACPCAFGIAAPAAIYSSSGLAAKNKILFSSAKIYEAINKINYLAFDKTGTLTTGKVKVIEQIGSNKYNDIISELTINSTHPLSKAINHYLKNKKTQNQFVIFKEVPGVGIIAKEKNKDYFLGSLIYSKNENFKLDVDIENYKNNILVVFAINKKIVSVFVLKDEIKKDAKKTIMKLKKIGIQPIIISGDRKEIVENIANELEINKYYYELLPIDKQKIVNEYKNIIFVGDGINDILAIKAATIGIAYSTGSEITNAMADISILETNLNSVYKAIILSQKTIKLIKLNFVWASLFNLICIPLAIIGLVPAWLGVILMTSSTLLLLCNTLITKRKNEKFLTKNS